MHAFLRGGKNGLLPKDRRDCSVTRAAMRKVVLGQRSTYSNISLKTSIIMTSGSKGVPLLQGLDRRSSHDVEAHVVDYP
jgi:hypothetical protein